MKCHSEVSFWKHYQLFSQLKGTAYSVSINGQSRDKTEKRPIIPELSVTQMKKF